MASSNGESLKRMTLCIAVLTSDGLVMGADSMTVVRTDSQSKHYSNADKVFEITNLPIVVMTYGLGAVGRRSIGSLIEEWNDVREPFEKSPHTVEDVARSVGEFVFSRHRTFRESIEHEAIKQQADALAGIAIEDRVSYDAADFTTGLVVGGYQPNSRYPWLYSWEDPPRAGVEPGLVCVRPHEGENGEDGPRPWVNYWGQTVALDRLFRGIDADLADHVRTLIEDAEKLAQADELAEEHRWPIVFEGMPLQDAADLVRFALEVGSGFERFKEGIPQIGGHLDIAAVTRRNVYWPARKPMTSALSVRLSSSSVRSSSETKS